MSITNISTRADDFTTQNTPFNGRYGVFNDIQFNATYNDENRVLSGNFYFISHSSNSNSTSSSANSTWSAVDGIGYRLRVVPYDFNSNQLQEIILISQMIYNVPDIRESYFNSNRMYNWDCRPNANSARNDVRAKMQHYGYNTMTGANIVNTVTAWYNDDGYVAPAFTSYFNSFKILLQKLGYTWTVSCEPYGYRYASDTGGNVYTAGSLQYNTTYPYPNSRSRSTPPNNGWKNFNVSLPQNTSTFKTYLDITRNNNVLKTVLLSWSSGGNPQGDITVDTPTKLWRKQSNTSGDWIKDSYVFYNNKKLHVWKVEGSTGNWIRK